MNGTLSTRNLIVRRKNNQRMMKLKTIDTENMKIFQNLSRIKSSISRQKLVKHDLNSTSIKEMLGKDKFRLDPLVSIERKRQTDPNRSSSIRLTTPFFKKTQTLKFQTGRETMMSHTQDIKTAGSSNSIMVNDYGRANN